MLGVEAVVLPSELSVLPWPAFLVSRNGAVLAASSAALALIGFEPSNVAEIEERFDFVSESGASIPQDARPLRRATRAEFFEASGIWRDRDSGRELSLRFRGRAVGAHGLLEVDSLPEDAERRAVARLSQLNETLRGRTAGQHSISIRELLLQLVLQACEITGARYGAVGVLNPDKTSLKDFIHVGVPDETAKAIGHLPEGKGLLGAVIHEATTIRVPDLAADPRSVGFPPGHPAMKSFLGVPLRVGGEIFGNFYVSDKQGGVAFTEEDARHLERFSAQASLTLAYVRQAEQEERRLFEIVVQYAPHGIVYFPADPSGEVLGNPAAVRTIGLITRANDPKRTYDLRYPDGTPLKDEELPSTRALRLEAVINLEVIIDRRRGGPIPGLISAAPVRSEAGAVLGAVVIFQDITALKQLQQLRQEFLALVAHDLRTPLQSVLLQVEALMRRTEGEAAYVPMTTLQAIRRNGLQLDRLVRDLLDASRIDAHGITLDLATVRLPDLASSIVSQIEGALGSHPISIEVSGNPPPVTADPRRIEQVVTNLLENASKYSAEGSEIRILIASADGGATIAVRDEGPGISPEELPQLFDRYFQTQRARTKGRGLGLGLFIAKGLVEAHGGSIHVESTPNVGSTFGVWLPSAAQASA
jgi:signal transduction histidine kinase